MPWHLWLIIIAGVLALVWILLTRLDKDKRAKAIRRRYLLARGICSHCEGSCKEVNEYYRMFPCQCCGGCGWAKQSEMIAEGVWDDYAKNRTPDQLAKHDYILKWVKR